MRGSELLFYTSSSFKSPEKKQQAKQRAAACGESDCSDFNSLNCNKNHHSRVEMLHVKNICIENHNSSACFSFFDSSEKKRAKANAERLRCARGEIPRVSCSAALAVITFAVAEKKWR